MIDPKLLSLIQDVSGSADAEGWGDDPASTEIAIAALTRYVEYINVMSQEEYVRNTGFLCPRCQEGSITYIGDLDSIMNTWRRACTCNKCGECWDAVYTLSGFVLKQEGKR